MTEDMVMEQSHVLSTLGTSEEAAKIRARMQSAQLMSDMESFKEIIYWGLGGRCLGMGCLCY